MLIHDYWAHCRVSCSSSIMLVFKYLVIECYATVYYSTYLYKSWSFIFQKSKLKLKNIHWAQRSHTSINSGLSAWGRDPQGSYLWWIWSIKNTNRSFLNSQFFIYCLFLIPCMTADFHTLALMDIFVFDDSTFKNLFTNIVNDIRNSQCIYNICL